MKYASALSITLLSLIVINSTHTAESSIDCIDARTQLKNDYKKYLLQQMEHYKKNNPITIPSLIEMGKTITGEERRCDIRERRNDKHETFLHIAVQKTDLSVILDILAFTGTLPTDIHNKSPLDVALEQLHPECEQPRNNDKIVALETIARHVAKKTSSTGATKESCLQKIVALELACKDRPHLPFTFTPNLDLLKSLASHKSNPDQFITDVYKQAIDDTTGNTFAHVCIHQKEPDDLFKLVCADRISESKNKEGLNPLELALQAFRVFTTNTILIETQPHKFNRIRCCYFILYNHYTKNSDNPCCEKHKTK